MSKNRRMLIRASSHALHTHSRTQRLLVVVVVVAFSPANLLRLISPGLSHATQAMLFAQAPCLLLLLHANRPSEMRPSRCPFSKTASHAFAIGYTRVLHGGPPRPPCEALAVRFAEKSTLVGDQGSNQQGSGSEGGAPKPSLQTEIDQVTADGQLIRIVSKAGSSTGSRQWP